MRFDMREFVRAFLPIVPLAMCPGCGGGSSAVAPVAQGPVPAADAPVALTTPTGNRAPTISGEAAQTAQVGNVYEFQPDWNDADGDALTFTATNLPPWAALDPHTGNLHGTPGSSDIGAYESISITVADASHHASTHDFSINVVGAASGVATVSWPAPVAKVDGSVLDDLAGFRILYGRDPEDLDHSVFIANPDVHSYEFATLDSGTWYFSVVAVNSEGLEGPATMPAMKVI